MSDFHNSIKYGKDWTFTSKKTKENEDLRKFGISFLDDALIGIANSDIILIAAGSGLGKSEIAVHIALNNALSGRKVTLLALEAEKHEVALRGKYKHLARCFYKDPYRDNSKKPNYMSWYYNQQEFLNKYDDQSFTDESFENLTIVYRDRKFDVEDVAKSMASFKDTDLVILDHFHYLDFDGDNENKKYKEIIVKIRELALQYNKPFVIMSHIRKQDKRTKELVPSQEEIHGTSDLFKVATKVVTIAKKHSEDFSKFESYMRICKCRQDGSRANYIGVVSFNNILNEYNDKYQVGTLSYDGADFNVCQDRFTPEWAKNSVIFPENTEEKRSEVYKRLIETRR